MLRSGKGFSRNGLASLKGNNRFKAISNHEMSIPTVLNQQQRQFMKMFQKNDVSKIREGIDGTSDEKKLGDYIRALAVSSPRDAIAQIERGWENGKIPVSEEIIREYLKSAAQLKVLDTVNLSGILALMQKPNGAAGAGTYI
jgi:predicted metal-dependent RNase